MTKIKKKKKKKEKKKGIFKWNLTKLEDYECSDINELKFW